MTESRAGSVPVDVEAMEQMLEDVFGEPDPAYVYQPHNQTRLFPLIKILPEVVAGLENLLAQTGEGALAESMSELYVYDRCRCGEDHCATVHTSPRPAGRFGPNHRCVVFWAAETICLNTGLPASSDERPTAPNTTILDVVDEEITRDHRQMWHDA